MESFSGNTEESAEDVPGEVYVTVSFTNRAIKKKELCVTFKRTLSTHQGLSLSLTDPTSVHTFDVRNRKDPERILYRMQRVGGFELVCVRESCCDLDLSHSQSPLRT